MRRKPRWYIIDETKAKTLEVRGFKVKFEKGKWRVLIEGRTLWAFANESAA